MRERALRLGGWLVRGVELVCALVFLLSAWMLRVLAESPAAQEGEGTFGVAFLLTGFLATVVLVILLAGQAVTRLVRAPSGGRLDAVVNALPRLAAEAGVATLAVLVWPLAAVPLDHVVFDATTAFAVAVVLHVTVDAGRFVRSVRG